MSHLSLPVEEFTTPNPLTADEDMSVENLMLLMKKEGVRHLPVVTRGKVVGIVSERDLRIAVALTPSQKNQVCARDVMVPDPVSVSCNDPLDKVAFRMSEMKIGSVIVNDENEELLGIFTVTDALNALIEVVRSK